MFWIITFILLLVVFVANMFSGGGSPRVVREIFFGNYYADKGVIDPEDAPNSRQAFEKCVAEGYGIKTEVQLTADRKLVVVNDANLLKNYGKDLEVSMAACEDITPCGILTLKELLDIVNGAVPVILELKSGHQNDILCRFTADAIYEYGYNNIAVSSFHSGIIAWFKHTEKKIFRGLISAPAKDFIALSPFDRFMVGNLANNSVCRPHFVIYRKGPESIFVKFAYYLGIVKGVWTCTDQQEARQLEAQKDFIVFSGFRPQTAHYKDLAVREKTQIEIDSEKRLEEQQARRLAKAQAKVMKKQGISPDSTVEIVSDETEATIDSVQQPDGFEDSIEK